MLNPFKRRDRKNQSLSQLAAEYYIGAGVSAEGILQTERDIYIDGSFNGEIKTDGLVELDANSKVKANITARALVVRGKLFGEAVIKETVSIAAGTKIEGKIYGREIEINPGAEINAMCQTVQEQVK